MKKIPLNISGLLLVIVFLFASGIKTGTISSHSVSDPVSSAINPSSVLISADSVQFLTIIPGTATAVSLLNTYPKPDSEDPKNYWNSVLKADSLHFELSSNLIKAGRLITPGLSIRVLIYPFHSFL